MGAEAPEISGETYKDYPELKDHVGNASVTELEILHAVLNPLHKGNKRDPEKHADYYDKARHAFFFLRDDSYLRQIPSDPPLLRKTYTNEWIVNPEERAKEDALLRTWREVHIPGTGRPVYPYRARWNPDASTPEIMLPLACPSTDTANIERWARQWRDAGVKVVGNTVAEKDKAKADEVNRRLSKGRLSDFTCEGKPFNNAIINSEGRPLHEVIIEGLKHAISTDERYADHQETVQDDELQKEIDQQEQFLFINSEGFIGRSGDFDALDDYVKDDSRKLFVITAPGGMGKTMLLANWLDRREGRGLECKESTFHYRFIGQGDRSTTVPNMLRSLMLELQQVAGKIPKTHEETSKDPQGNEVTREVPLEIPYDPEKLMAMWLEYLPRLEGKTVIVVDAVNQLESGLAYLRWAPLNGLPGQVKLIISLREDAREGKELVEKLRGNDHVLLHRIPPFEDIEDRRRLVKAYLDQYLKDIDHAHLEEIIQMEGAGNPLFLKVVLSELRVFGSFQHLAQKIQKDFGENPEEAFHGVLGRLEEDPAYSSIQPKQAVPLLFGLLSHARYGLSVDELSRLFMHVLKLADNAAGYRSASETVSLFIRQVRPFLALRDGRYDFFYESFRVAATERYEADLDEFPYRATPQGWHRELSDYFYQLPLWAGKDEKGNDLPNRRKVSELPYHLIQGGVWERVEEVLTDLYFIEAKCRAGMTYELIMDYNMALDGLPEAKQKREKEILRYTDEIIDYARKWSDARDRHAQDPTKYPMPKPEDIPLPKIIESVKPWTDEEIEADTQRIIKNPTRLDRIKLFSQFVNSEAHNFAKYAAHPMFCIQQAYNSANAGPVHGTASKILKHNTDTTNILLKKSSLPPFNPHPAILRTLEGHKRSVDSVWLTPEGRRAISESHSEKTLRVWNVDTGECMRILRGHTGFVIGVILTSDGYRAVSRSENKTLQVWDIETGQCLHTLQGHTGYISLTPDGRRVVSGSYDKTLRVWDVAKEQCLCTLKGFTNDEIGDVIITPDGRRVISLIGENINLSLKSWWKEIYNTVLMWDVETGRCLQTMKMHMRSGAMLTRDGRYVVGRDKDDMLKVWDVETGECLHTLKNLTDDVRTLKLTSDVRFAVSVNEDNTLRVWDVETGQCLRTLKEYTEEYAVHAVAVSLTADGRRAVLGGDDGKLRVWDIESGQCLHILEGHTGRVTAVDIMPDGCRAISGSADKTLRIWNVETGRCRRIFKGHKNCVTDVSLIPGGSLVISGSIDETLRVWNVETGRCLLTFGEYAGWIEAIRLTSDGRLALLKVSGGIQDYEHYTLRILDINNFECQNIFEVYTPFVTAVDITPDGRLGVFSIDNKLQVLNFNKIDRNDWDDLDEESEQCLHTLEGHTERVTAVDIMPDGRRAISGSDDKTLRIWNVETGQCLRTLEGHTDCVYSVSLTPDGRRAVSMDGDNTLWVWDLESGLCLVTIALSSPICSIAIKYPQIIVGLSSGKVNFLEMLRLKIEKPIITPIRLWLYGIKGKQGKWDDDITALCEWCGKRFVPEKKILDTIAGITRDARLSPDDSPCLKLPQEAFNDPRLISACPHCHQPLKFNPFVVDNRERY